MLNQVQHDSYVELYDFIYKGYLFFAESVFFVTLNWFQGLLVQCTFTDAETSSE